MLYIAIGNLAVFLLNFMMPIQSHLRLIPSLVLKGQVWRLVTYVFIPPQTSILFILFTVYFYYMIGTTLEREWGSFKLNIYYLVGMIATTIAAFITGGSDATHLNLSLFLAFAYVSKLRNSFVLYSSHQNKIPCLAECCLYRVYRSVRTS